MSLIKKISIFLFYISCAFAERAYAIEKNNLSVVVFDFGGVIVKANTTKMANFLMHSFKINQNELSNALNDMQNFVAKGGSEKQFWKQYAIAKNVELPNNWCDRFAIVIQESIIPIPESIAIVKRLQKQGYQTALFSNITQYQSEVIRTMGYYDLFNPVLLSYEMGVEKPNPEAFKKLAKTLELPISSILFIDDKNENVEAAKNLGIDSIQFMNPQQLKDELEKRGFELNNAMSRASMFRYETWCMN